MDLEVLAVILAVIGIAVPTFAFLWEFFFARRKRLGYRIQLNTSAIGGVGADYAGILAGMRQADGTPLVDPSFVLVRIENDGVTPIDESDYQVLSDVRAGVRIRFPGRRVAGMVVTELSNPTWATTSARTSGSTSARRAAKPTERRGSSTCPRCR